MVAGGIACPGCRSPRSRATFEVRGHRFRRCRDCATVFVERPPDPRTLSDLYKSERYFANPGYPGDDFSGYRDYLADREEIEEKFDGVLAELERFVAPGRLLDVGAGPGLLLVVARSRGWDAIGLDLNPWAATWAREELGLQVELSSLETARLESAGFDAVTMLDLIEHVPDPDALMIEAARVTRPGGALAVLTPDAGSPTTRLLGRRWPEVQRAGEHLALFSVTGLSALLRRNGFEPIGWRWIGKTSSLSTLAADLTPIAPAAGRAAQRALAGGALGRRRVELNPRAKFCLYAQRETDGALDPPPRVESTSAPGIAPPRLPAPARPGVEVAVREELEHLSRARRLCDWMFEQFAGDVRGSVAEVGAGIGTFSARLLEAGAGDLLLLEPDPVCREALERRFAGQSRVRVVADALPDAPSLGEGAHDLVLCQNVLEHVKHDAASVEAMARALKPGGRLDLLVPARPGLFGRLDLTYGHLRRYDEDRVRSLLEAAGLTILELRPFNLLGIGGWWAKNRVPSPRVGPRSLGAYEALVRLWRPLEERLRPRSGLSLIARAERPPA